MMDMATTVASKPEQLTISVEITPEQKEIIQRAAEISGRTIEEFFVTTTLAEADVILYGRQSVAVHVSLEAYERILDMMDDPGEPNEYLRAAFERHRAMFGE
jgi:uncharacterized protein (DUF1778 family)